MPSYKKSFNNNNLPKQQHELVDPEELRKPERNLGLSYLRVAIAKSTRPEIVDNTNVQPNVQQTVEPMVPPEKTVATEEVYGREQYTPNPDNYRSSNQEKMAAQARADAMAAMGIQIDDDGNYKTIHTQSQANRTEADMVGSYEEYDLAA